MYVDGEISVKEVQAMIASVSGCFFSKYMVMGGKRHFRVNIDGDHITVII
jgi:hypothetical protein